MFKVEIQTPHVEESHIPAKEGKPAKILRKQTAYFFNGGVYPLTTSILLKDNQPAYAAGFYEVAPQSFEVGQFGRINFNLQLGKPLPAEVRKVS